jgi:glycosyltransferase involved in cell wall biosynthesis
MAQRLRASETLRLYTHQPPQPAEWPSGPRIETRCLPFPRLWTHLRLATELSLHPPDVLFVPAHVLPLHCPVPAAVTVHDLGYLHFPEAHTRFQRWYLNWTTRRHARHAEHLIADSEATAADLRQHYHAPAERISVVHLGRDPHLGPVDPAPVRQKYGLSQPYLLYLGTLQPRKNLLRLLTAFEQISPDFPHHLVLAGRPGWLAEAILEQASQLNLRQRIHLPGYIPQADKAGLLSGATAYVFPSLYEGFGLPVLEAMACGTPVLTSNTTSLPEIAGQAALFVNPEDTASIAQGLRRLLSDSPLRADLRERGLKQVQKFSWGQAAESVLSILRKVARQ